jgi:hypothetical protein
MRPFQTAVLLLVCLLPACGVTTPSDLIVEPTQMGQIVPGSGVPITFLFSTKNTGEFIATVTAISPDSGVTVFAGYGFPAVNNTLCGIQNQAFAGQGHTVFDQTLPKGDYCFQLSESPNFPLQRTETFTYVIKHS